MLNAKSISFQVNQSCLLQPVSLDFTQGLFHVVMGPNGAGKSTLLRLLAGELQPSSGKVYLNGKDLGQYTKMELATKRAVLSQQYNVTFPISVNDIVQMGRYPHFKSSPLQQDRVVCKQAMERMNVYDLRERDYNTLSGGEAQKVQMSRVLSQIWEAKPGDEKWLFLDEPVSHLDVKYQRQLLNTAKNLCKQHTTVIAVLHDINLAVAYADRILFMKQGRVVHDLVRPNEFSPAIIKEIFDVDSTIIYPENHAPVVVF